MYCFSSLAVCALLLVLAAAAPSTAGPVGATAVLPAAEQTLLHAKRVLRSDNPAVAKGGARPVAAANTVGGAAVAAPPRSLEDAEIEKLEAMTPAQLRAYKKLDGYTDEFMVAMRRGLIDELKRFRDRKMTRPLRTTPIYVFD